MQLKFSLYLCVCKCMPVSGDQRTTFGKCLLSYPDSLIPTYQKKYTGLFICGNVCMCVHPPQSLPLTFTHWANLLPTLPYFLRQGSRSLTLECAVSAPLSGSPAWALPVSITVTDMTAPRSHCVTMDYSSGPYVHCKL